MTSFVKNTLIIIIILGLISGITYLGINISNLNKLQTPTSTLQLNSELSQPAPSSESNIPKEFLTISQENGKKLEEFKSCQSSIECTLISEPVGTNDAGQEVTQNNCLNEQYLKSCKNCRIDKDFQAELAKTKTCNCILNYCRLTSRDGSDGINY